MGMFGKGFDWKAAALAFANPEAGMRYADRRDKKREEEEALAPVLGAIESDPSLSPEDRVFAKANPSAYVQSRMKRMEPINNDTVNDYKFIEERLGKEAADLYLRRKGDPIINTTLPGDRFFSGPSSQLSAALGGYGGGGQPMTQPAANAPPPQAIADLKSNPASAAQFDEIFGPGSSARILGRGGPTQPASGGFHGAFNPFLPRR